MLAAHRAREIASGAPLTVARDNDKNPVVSLREIAEETQLADDLRERMIEAHQTQIDPSSTWFAVPPQVQREIWPTEEFELARSTVVTAFPEDDLFAGLRQE